MLKVKLPFVGTIHPQSNQFVTDVKIKATGVLKLNVSPDILELEVSILSLDLAINYNYIISMSIRRFSCFFSFPTQKSLVQTLAAKEI